MNREEFLVKVDEIHSAALSAGDDWGLQLTNMVSALAKELPKDHDVFDSAWEEWEQY